MSNTDDLIKRESYMGLDMPPGMLDMRRNQTDNIPRSNYSFNDKPLVFSEDIGFMPELHHNITTNTGMDYPDYHMPAPLNRNESTNSAARSPARPVPVILSAYPKDNAEPAKQNYLLSFGSSYHEGGTCRPCRYEWTRGCHLGLQCRFCHHEDHMPPGSVRVKVSPNQSNMVTLPASKSNNQQQQQQQDHQGAPSKTPRQPQPHSHHHNHHGHHHNRHHETPAAAAPQQQQQQQQQGDSPSPHILSSPQELAAALPVCNCRGVDPNCVPLQQLYAMSNYLNWLVARLSNAHASATAMASASNMLHPSMQQQQQQQQQGGPTGGANGQNGGFMPPPWMMMMSGMNNSSPTGGNMVGGSWDAPSSPSLMPSGGYPTTMDASVINEPPRLQKGSANVTANSTITQH